MRENRLYQADWLMRYYGFAPDEILDTRQPFLDLEIDPKLAWALRHPHLFPVDVNTAPREMLLRIPGGRRTLSAEDTHSAHLPKTHLLQSQTDRSNPQPSQILHHLQRGNPISRHYGAHKTPPFAHRQ